MTRTIVSPCPALLLSVLLGLLSPGTLAAQASPFAACTTAPADTTVGLDLRAIYIPMHDGVRIAAEVALPANLKPGTRLPTVMIATRYWRAAAGLPPSGQARFFVSNGYAVVSTDVRGTGASFGTWLHPWSSTEVNDLGEVVKWIAAQPWSDRKVGTIGTSYTANTAQLAAVAGGPAVRAVIPRFMDFDVWSDLISPGGLINDFIIREWGTMVHAMDMNEQTGETPRGVKPVDEDRDGSLLAAAVRDHQANPKLHEVAATAIYRDDSVTAWRSSNDDYATYRRRAAIERSGAPIFGWASWLDSGTANGLLSRYLTWSNPQYVVLGAWSHGAGFNASPFAPVDAETSPPRSAQNQAALCYFDEFLKGRPHGLRERKIFYYTLAAERWDSTSVWPLPGTTAARWYLTAGNRLATRGPGSIGTDRYAVDFEATTGTTNRWYTQLGGGDVIYPDRRDEDQRLLTYTSQPLDRDVQVTGNAVVTLRLTTTATDGSFFAYLEDVAPDGRVTYVTEGQLRGLHRKISASAPPYRVLYPYHSLRKRDGAPMVPGQVTELKFGLLPTSVLFRRGHQIRLALAGADKDTFRRIPETGPVEWMVQRSPVQPSYLELPVVRRKQ